jgi:predicted PurR-regulated permease PerM
VNLQSLQLSQRILQASTALGKILLNQGGSIFGDVTALFGQFLLMLFAFFFMVRDLDVLLRTSLHLLPLSASHERKIIEKVTEVARSAILGTLVTALAQGVAGGIAFQIAGLPGVFWGTVMAFTALIPLAGTTVIWGPAALYLILSGHWGYGIFLLLWGILVVSMLDNILRPLFMAGKGKNATSTLLIFLSLLGGVNYFGLVGILYGPLVVGLTLVLLYIYSLEFKAFLAYQDKS